jgi:hypothetical protein
MQVIGVTKPIVSKQMRRKPRQPQRWSSLNKGSSLWLSTQRNATARHGPTIDTYVFTHEHFGFDGNGRNAMIV